MEGTQAPGSECVESGAAMNDMRGLERVRPGWVVTTLNHRTSFDRSRVDLEPHGLAPRVVDVSPPLRRERVDERKSPTTDRVLLSRPRHRQSWVAISNGDPKASPIERENQFQRRPGVADTVADELGHQQADRVREGRETPSSQRRKRDATGFGGACRHGWQSCSGLDRKDIP